MREGLGDHAENHQQGQLREQILSGRLTVQSVTEREHEQSKAGRNPLQKNNNKHTHLLRRRLDGIRW